MLMMLSFISIMMLLLIFRVCISKKENILKRDLFFLVIKTPLSLFYSAVFVFCTKTFSVVVLLFIQFVFIQRNVNKNPNKANKYVKKINSNNNINTTMYISTYNVRRTYIYMFILLRVCMCVSCCCFGFKINFRIKLNYDVMFFFIFLLVFTHFC